MSAAGAEMLFEISPTSRSMDAANVPLRAACSRPTTSVTSDVSGVARGRAAVTMILTVPLTIRHEGTACRRA